MKKHHPLVPLLGVLIGGVALILAAPSSDNDFEDVFYDQRQNGSENFRIHLNDVMVVVAPAEALLSVAAGSELLNPTPSDNVPLDDPDKLPKECKPGGKGKCNKQSTTAGNAATKRSRLRLSNLLMPFINRAHH
ncbi:uncharacterized protein LOC142322913 [Lycorma delicatula]|uniref:uncharacterized protein LOC142322913 n=1 Tax=Lycorma delicatula TaxID=130591 RepID=UPI003F51987C